jgi:hypothetical protein
MNQINLDKLLQLAPAGKADTATLKLMIAQVYQGQVQQLSSGQFRLQLPSAQGAVQVNLPAAASAALQQLMPQSASDSTRNPAQLSAQANLPAQALQKLSVLVQFQPQNDGRISLNLQSAGAASTITLQPTQLRQLLLAVYASLTAVTPSHTKSKENSNALVTAQLQNPSAGPVIQLPRVAPIAISAQAQSALTPLLSGSHSNQITVELELSNTETIVSANIRLPATD